MDEIAVTPRCMNENVGTKVEATDTKASKGLISTKTSLIDSIGIDRFSQILLLMHLLFPAHLLQVPAISFLLLETVVISFVNLLLNNLTKQGPGLTANNRAQIKPEILPQAIDHQCKALHQHR